MFNEEKGIKMKKNTWIISGIVLGLIIVLIIIFVIFASNRNIVYEEGAPNVAVTIFTTEMGNNLVKQLYPNEKASVKTMSYTEAYESLINGTNDLMLALAPTEEMIEYSKTTLAEIEMIPIAKDALVVMNNRYNPVKNISYEQFCKIFTGDAKNWKEFGGEDYEILPYINTSAYDSYFALRDLLDGNNPVMPKLTLKIPNLANVVKAIGEYEDTSDSAVGYALFYQSEELFENKNVDILSINNVAPSVKTITSGEYPLTLNIYAIIRKDSAENSRARRLVNFILSQEGQNIIDKNGYFMK